MLGSTSHKKSPLNTASYQPLGNFGKSSLNLTLENRIIRTKTHKIIKKIALYFRSFVNVAFTLSHFVIDLSWILFQNQFLFCTCLWTEWVMVFSGVERLTIHFQKSHHPLWLWPWLTSSLGSHYPDPLPTLGTSVWQACTLPGIRHPYLMEPLPCQVTWKTRIVSVCLGDL